MSSVEPAFWGIEALGCGQGAVVSCDRPCFLAAQIASDRVTQLAKHNWSNEARESEDAPKFKPELVQSIYRSELGGGGKRLPSHKRIMLLEISQYLENYLWPNFDAESASFEHVMSMVLMVNEKFREGVPAWTCFHTREVRSCHSL